MKKIGLLFILIITFSQGYAQTSIFNDLLQKHVSDDGIVDYKNFNGQKLRKFTMYLENTSPNKNWSRAKQKAFWINAYNAYTIHLILHAQYAKKIKTSIMDLNQKGKNAWKIPFAKIGGKTYTLDYIEHQILRKQLFDARIHVGVNCASISCPKLHNKAFTEANVNSELEKLMKSFMNDNVRNKFKNSNLIYISEIFNWFKDDFIKKGTIIDYINKYSDKKINANATINFLPYDWNLNGK